MPKNGKNLKWMSCEFNSHRAGFTMTSQYWSAKQYRSRICNDVRPPDESFSVCHTFPCTDERIDRKVTEFVALG